MSYIKKIKLPAASEAYSIYDSEALHSGDNISLLNNDASYATTTYVDNKTAGLTGAMHFKGAVTSLPTDFSTYDSGDVVLLNNKEYVCDKTDESSPKWVELGDEGSYVLKTQTINGKALSGDIELSATDIGALSSDTSIPSKTSELTNDSGFITSAGVPVQSVNGETGAVTIESLKNPTALTITTSDGTVYTYDGSTAQSITLSGGGGTTIVVSDTEPTLDVRDLWFKVIS